MNPYYEDAKAGIVLYHGDCRDVMAAIDLSSVDFVLADPPYGIGYDASKSTQLGITKHAQIAGDDAVFDPTPLLGFRDAILWGCNHYCHAIPPKEGQWYFWDKVTKNGTKVRIAEGEFCWHKLGTKPRAFRHLWSGAYRASEAGDSSLHPNQKPKLLMKWCIEQSPTTGAILDPFTGSGTTLAVARGLFRAAIGIELEEKYCEIAANRLRQEVSPLWD
jgi:DNA modification methylase